MGFPPWGYPDHVVLVSSGFPSNSKRVVTFHCIASNYPCVDWEGIHDHLRDVPREDVYKYASDVVKEFWEWIQVGIYVLYPSL